MSESYSRTVSVERGPQKGMLHGIVATDGEAADGHILSIRGAKAEAPAPLLFGHDATSGRSNLGSWTHFDVKYGKRALGDSAIRGFAQIELGGEGPQAAWRADIAHMVEQGHIRSFSVRWEPLEEPTPRHSLPKEHAAHAEGKGYFFPRWRLLEVSLVTLGSDPNALIGRAMEGPPELAQEWLRAAQQCLELKQEIQQKPVFEDSKAVFEEALTCLYEAKDCLRTAVDLTLQQLARHVEPRLPAEVAPAEPPPKPEPPKKQPERLTPDKFLSLLAQELDARDDKNYSTLLDQLDARTGRIR